jgi:hypothetical protein
VFSAQGKPQGIFLFSMETQPLAGSLEWLVGCGIRVGNTNIDDAAALLVL